MSFAALTIDIKASLAKFEEDLRKVTSSTKRFESGLGTLKRSLVGLGLGVSVAGVVRFAKSAIDAADHLNDLSATTKLSVTQLAGLQLAAKQSGTDIDGVAASVSRLSVNIGKDPKKYAAIGIAAKEPIKQLEQLADVLSRIKDPSTRAAVAQEALGKSWQSVMPLLGQGADALRKTVEQGAAYAHQMQLMADRSNDFNNKIDDTNAKLQGLTIDILTPLLPMMINLADYIGQFGSKAKTATDDLTPFANVLGFIVASGAGTAFVIEGIAKSLTLLAIPFKLMDKKSASGLFDQFTADMKKSAQDLADFQRKIFNPDYTPIQVRPPKRDDTDTSESKLNDFLNRLAKEDAVRKKALENGLKIIEASAQAEADALANSSSILDAYYNDNVVSIKDYYAAKKFAQDSALTNTLAGYDQEIAARKKYRASLSQDGDRADETGKIIDLEEKKKKLITDSAQAETQSAMQEIRNKKDLNIILSDLNIQYLDMIGNKAKAAELSFNLANANTIERIGTEKNTDAQAKLKELRARAIEAASTAGGDGFKRGLRHYVEMTQDAGKQIEGLVTDTFGGMEDALVKFVQTGKLDFKSFADSIVADLARIAIQRSITGPLASAALAVSSSIPFPFATGGIMTSHGPLQLKKYAGGGIAKGPQLAMFGEGRKPEAFVPLPDGKRIPVDMRGSGANVVVNVVEAPGKGGRTNERNEGGNRIIDVFVEQVKNAIGSDIARGNGAVPAAIERTYGLGRAAGTY